MKKFQTYHDLRRDALKDISVKGAYDAFEPEYRMAESMIQARLSQKLTQEELAAKAGVSQTTIARLESGTNNPTIVTVHRVASVLGKELRLV